MKTHLITTSTSGFEFFQLLHQELPREEKKGTRGIFKFEIYNCFLNLLIVYIWAPTYELTDLELQIAGSISK